MRDHGHCISLSHSASCYLLTNCAIYRSDVNVCLATLHCPAHQDSLTLVALRPRQHSSGQTTVVQRSRQHSSGQTTVVQRSRQHSSGQTTVVQRSRQHSSGQTTVVLHLQTTFIRTVQQATAVLHLQTTFIRTVQQTTVVLHLQTTFIRTVQQTAVVLHLQTTFIRTDNSRPTPPDNIHQDRQQSSYTSRQHSSGQTTVISRVVRRKMVPSAHQKVRRGFCLFVCLFVCLLIHCFAFVLSRDLGGQYRLFSGLGGQYLCYSVVWVVNICVIQWFVLLVFV